MTILDTSDLLTVEQVAQMLQVTPRTVRNHIHANHLPASKMAGGKNWRIRRSDLGNLLRPDAASVLSQQSPVIDRLDTPAGRTQAVAALRALREGDAEEQLHTLTLLQKTEREEPLSFRSESSAALPDENDA